MNTSHSKTSEEPTKRGILRQHADKVRKINQTGPKERYYLTETNNHDLKSGTISGLILDIKRNKTHTYLTLVDGNTKLGRRTIEIPNAVYDNTSRMIRESHRQLLDENEHDHKQYLPVDKNGNLTLNKDEIESTVQISIYKLPEILKNQWKKEWEGG